MVKKKWLEFLPFVFALVATRFLFLGDKAYHHDESLYAVYSLKIAQHLEYVFDPMLHGPTLYFFQGLLFSIFGDNDMTGRLASAFSGIILVFAIGFVFRDQHKTRLRTWLLLAISSPVLTYFSRFLGMDMLMCAIVGLILYGFHSALQDKENDTPYILLICLLISLLVCTKLNFLFYLFIFATFPLALFLMKDPNVNYDLFLSYFKKHLSTLVMGTLSFIVIFCFLYSGAFKHPEGIIDGLYRKMLPYWIGQHKMERIGGAFFYYLPIFGVYELPLVLLISAGTLNFLKKLGYRVALFALGCLLLGFLLKHQAITLSQWVDKVFHMHNPWDLPLTIFLVAVAVFHFKGHVRRQETWSAFFLYWFVISFFLYSYAGEKVPWLTTHVVFPGYLYIASLSDKFLTSPKWRVCFFIVIAWQSFNVVRTCLLNPANPNEMLVYTHTSKDIPKLVEKINVLAKSSALGNKMVIQIPAKASAVWPMAWYLRNYASWFVQEPDVGKNPAVVMYDWHLQQELPLEIRNYYSETYKFRVWWVPDASKQTVANTLQYFFWHEPFNDVGSLDIQVFVRPDLASIWPKP